MKNLKTLLLIAVFTLCVGGVANAQKIGHINYERVIANMPETRALQAEIAKIGKTYKDDIEASKKKLDDKIKKYTAEQATQTEETNKKRAQEVQGDNYRNQQAEQAAYQDIQQKQNSRLIPIIEKAKKAIQDIAKAKGLLYILDASQGRGVLVADGVDVYEDAKAKLGLLKDLPKPKQPGK